MANTPEGYDYVALQPIMYDGVRAFNTGDPVPTAHVKDHGLSEDQVAKAGTQKAKRAQGVVEEEAAEATSTPAKTRA